MTQLQVSDLAIEDVNASFSDHIDNFRVVNEFIWPRGTMHERTRTRYVTARSNHTDATRAHCASVGSQQSWSVDARQSGYVRVNKVVMHKMRKMAGRDLATA